MFFGPGSANNFNMGGGHFGGGGFSDFDHIFSSFGRGKGSVGKEDRSGRHGSHFPGGFGNDVFSQFFTRR